MKDPMEARARFSGQYRTGMPPVRRLIERRVIGGDWGANGYTTLAEADLLARDLRITAADSLLDIGTGRGWPGLYLAARTGCRAVVIDMPIDGLRQAVSRATAEGLGARAAAVVAAAGALPFRPHSFDVIVHTDVLC